MKVYVAGSMYSLGIEYVKGIQAAVRACGHEITYDWTTQMIGDTGEQAARELAEAERDGVLDADLLILIDHNRPRGALIELGMALGTGKETLVLLEEERKPSLFYNLPNSTPVARRSRSSASKMGSSFPSPSRSMT